jgi:uridine kinase
MMIGEPLTQTQLFVGIAGGSGAGKSLLARRVSELTPEACVLDLDAYYRDRSHLTPEERAAINFDEPDAFDIDLLLRHLKTLRLGRPVPKPVYSFEHHCRVGERETSSAPLVIVEGLFTLWWPAVREALDFTVFVDAPADIRLTRRIRRDVQERGRTVASVLEQYLRSVRPMHERFVEPTRVYADLVVGNDGEIDAVVVALQAALRAAIGRPA